MRKLKLQMNGKNFQWDDEVNNFCIENLHFTWTKHG